MKALQNYKKHLTIYYKLLFFTYEKMFFMVLFDFFVVILKYKFDPYIIKLIKNTYLYQMKHTIQ